MSIGKSPFYAFLKKDRFEFPEVIKLNDIEITNERRFLEFLLRNDWIQRDLGIRMNSSNGLFPDIKGEIYDDPETKIRVEVEYYAETFGLHKHNPRGCHLILSFIRKPCTRVYKTVPVWSFYKQINDELHFCLYDDIDFDFDKYNPED